MDIINLDHLSANPVLPEVQEAMIDTIKNNLSDYFPFLIPALNNLYEIIFDISSFIKDLIK